MFVACHGQVFISDDRSTIISIHMIFEAGTLCDCIAILAKVKLIMVGKKPHRKGEGNLWTRGTCPAIIESVAQLSRERATRKLCHLSKQDYIIRTSD